MSTEPHRYPDDWPQLSISIRKQVGWVCQHCGKGCRMPGESLSDYIKRSGYPEEEVRAHPTRFVLDGAHLDQNPGNSDRNNLRALCRVCHLEYDRRWIGFNMMRRRERWGQMMMSIIN